MKNISIKSSIVPGSKPQRFRDGGRAHKNVRIYLHAENETDLDNIVRVEYVLHPTFKHRYRTSDNRTKKFEIRIWTYGYFKIEARLTLNDNSVKTISGFVRWAPLNEE